MKNYAKAIGLYIVFINIGVVFSMVVMSVIGYLPYSDRPGPSWQGPHFSLRETRFFFSWSISFSPYSIFYGTGIFFLAQLLRRSRLSHFIRAFVTGIVSGIASMYLVAGAGWIVAIGGPPVYIAGLLGLSYGAWVLPKYLGIDLKGVPFSKLEKYLIPVAFLVFTATIYLAFCYRPYSQDFNVNIIAPQDSTADISIDDWLTADEKAILLAKNLNRKYEVGFRSMFSQGGNTEKSRVLIIIQKGKGNHAVPPQPRNSNVIFIEEKGEWVMYPKDAPFLKRKIYLRQFDNDSNQWSIQIEPEKENIFSWKPGK